MLPSLNSAQLSLADVLPSCLASLGVPGITNSLELPSVKSAVIVLVDGLGEHNLSSAQAHARFLAQKSAQRPALSTVFPSTTAAALASLTTGSNPGQHGMTGYKVRNPESGEILNLLTGLGVLAQPGSWMASPPLYSIAEDHGITATVVAHPRFADTPLTEIIHSGATQLGAKSVDDRVDAVLNTLQRPGQHLILLYVSELDELAHNKGVNSPEWAAALESLDGSLKALEQRLPEGVGVIVTADHGVMDVPSTRHYLYGNDLEYMRHIGQVGGEPRCLQLYFDEDVSEQEKLATLGSWKKDWSELAWVLSRDEVINAELYGECTPLVLERLGDIFVLAKKDVVFYDERDTTLKGRNMIGQHGGISPVELAIPDIRLGEYA